MGCNYSTSNIMDRGECGMRPLLVEILKRVISYINNVKSRPSAVCSKALRYEYTNDISPNITKFVNKFILQGVSLDSADKPKINKMCIERYNEFWKKELLASPKTISYVLFKNRISMESYLYNIKSPKLRNALARFRLSNHSLMIEKGRQMRPRIERSERKCLVCVTEVENELHFVTQCPLYENERKALYQACQRNATAFEEIPTDEQKFIFILSNENTEVTNALAHFVCNSFDIRKSVT